MESVIHVWPKLLIALKPQMVALGLKGDELGVAERQCAPCRFIALNFGPKQLLGGASEYAGHYAATDNSTAANMARPRRAR